MIVNIRLLDKAERRKVHVLELPRDPYVVQNVPEGY